MDEAVSPSPTCLFTITGVLSTSKFRVVTLKALMRVASAPKLTPAIPEKANRWPGLGVRHRVLMGVRGSSAAKLFPPDEIKDREEADTNDIDEEKGGVAGVERMV
jgi:hypothetical protein